MNDTVGPFPGPNKLDPVTQSVLEMLGQLGLIYPLKIEQDEIIQFPLNLTEVGFDELGELNSYYAAQCARHMAILGVLQAQKKSLKFLQMKAKRKAETTGLPEDKLVLERYEHQFARADAAEAIINGDVDAMKKYSDACSRELTRRQVEAHLSR